MDIIEQQWGSRRGPRAALLRKARRGQQQVAPPKEGRIEIALPITVRSLSETIGVKVGDLIKRLLKESGQLYGNNSTVDLDTAARWQAQSALVRRSVAPKLKAYLGRSA